MPPTDNLVVLPDDSDTLKAVVRALLAECDQEKQRAAEQQQRADGLYLQNLRLQVELGRLKKWYYGPCADRLQTGGDLAQLLLGFTEAIDRKPINPADVPPNAEPEEELRRVKRRKGRRRIADFENLPATTHVHELSAEQRLCPCCGIERKEIGQEQSWQIEYFPGHFERIQYVRKKCAFHYTKLKLRAGMTKTARLRIFTIKGIGLLDELEGVDVLQGCSPSLPPWLD